MTNKLKVVVILSLVAGFMTLVAINQSNAQTPAHQHTEGVYYDGAYYALQYDASRNEGYIKLADGQVIVIHKLNDDDMKPAAKSSGGALRDNGDGTASYKGQSYQVQTGSRGGRYIVVDGVKKYLPKSD